MRTSFYTFELFAIYYYQPHILISILVIVHWLVNLILYNTTKKSSALFLVYIKKTCIYIV